MGRPRTITDDRLLDAATTVIGRCGAAALTLEAVAFEAKVSKASVLYFYRSKRKLVEAVVDRAVRLDTEWNEQAIEACKEHDAAVVRGRIHAAGKETEGSLRDLALNLCAAMAQHAELREPSQRYQAEIQRRILSTSSCPRTAMLAHLALEGFKLLELFGIHSWPKKQRRQLLADIEWLLSVKSQPDQQEPSRSEEQKQMKVRRARSSRVAE